MLPASATLAPATSEQLRLRRLEVWGDRHLDASTNNARPHFTLTTHTVGTLTAVCSMQWKGGWTEQKSSALQCHGPAEYWPLLLLSSYQPEGRSFPQLLSHGPYLILPPRLHSAAPTQACHPPPGVGAPRLRAHTHEAPLSLLPC